jgi:hypothetical protein
MHGIVDGIRVVTACAKVKVGTLTTLVPRPLNGVATTRIAGNTLMTTNRNSRWLAHHSDLGSACERQRTRLVVTKERMCGIVGVGLIVTVCAKIKVGTIMTVKSRALNGLTAARITGNTIMTDIGNSNWVACCSRLGRTCERC